MSILGGDYKKELLALIDFHQLPVAYGGTGRPLGSSEEETCYRLFVQNVNQKKVITVNGAGGFDLGKGRLDLLRGRTTMAGIAGVPASVYRGRAGATSRGSAVDSNSNSDIGSGSCSPISIQRSRRIRVVEKSGANVRRENWTHTLSNPVSDECAGADQSAGGACERRNCIGSVSNSQNDDCVHRGGAFGDEKAYDFNCDDGSRDVRTEVGDSDEDSQPLLSIRSLARYQRKSCRNSRQHCMNSY